METTTINWLPWKPSSRPSKKKSSPRAVHPFTCRPFSDKFPVCSWTHSWITVHKIPSSLLLYRLVGSRTESCFRNRRNRRNRRRMGIAQVHHNERRVLQTAFCVLYGAGGPLPSEHVTSIVGGCRAWYFLSRSPSTVPNSTIQVKQAKALSSYLARQSRLSPRLRIIHALMPASVLTGVNTSVTYLKGPQHRDHTHSPSFLLLRSTLDFLLAIVYKSVRYRGKVTGP